MANEIGVSLLCLARVMNHLSWNPPVFEPMQVLDPARNDNHRRAPHKLQYAPWQKCLLDDLRQPASPIQANVLVQPARTNSFIREVKQSRITFA